MATITTLAQAGGVTSATRNWLATPVLYSNTIDFAQALAAKGSALASADVIEAIRIPAGCFILGAGLQTIEVDDATTLTIGVGTDLDPDGFVDAYDQAAAIAGAYGTSLFDTSEIHTLYTAANSIDIVFETLTGTLTVGKVRVFAWVLDINGAPEPGLVQIGS